MAMGGYPVRSHKIPILFLKGTFINKVLASKEHVILVFILISIEYPINSNESLKQYLQNWFPIEFSAFGNHFARLFVGD